MHLQANDAECGSKETRLDDPQAVRVAMRADLVAAMKVRETETVTALRTALAAIDNAEAVDLTAGAGTEASGAIAGAKRGVGSTEVARRDLTIEDVRDLIRRQIDERIGAAEQYASRGQPEAADRLRREANVLRKYVKP